MSCKIIQPDAPFRIEEMRWRRVKGGDGSATQDHAGSARCSGPPGDPDRRAAEIARAEEQARARGFQEGEAAAARQAAERVEKIVARAAASIEALEQVRRQMRRQMEEDLVKLAVAVARRILHRELSVDPDALQGVVKAAVGRIEARELHRIRVSPEDCPQLEKALKYAALPPRVELTADSGLERGSLVLETDRGLYDASVETQLQEIERGFTDLLRRSA